jgi:hypothetical protein
VTGIDRGKDQSARMAAYRRLPNLLYRRFPNRLGVEVRERDGVAEACGFGNRETADGSLRYGLEHPKGRPPDFRRQKVCKKCLLTLAVVVLEKPGVSFKE